MFNSQKQILIFEIILFLIFLLNSFVSNILEGYKIILILIVAIGIFYKLFGYEKDNFRYKKAIIIETVVFLIMFFALFYIFGMVIGFARIENYFSYIGMRDFIIPIILTIVLREILRYMIVTKCSNNIKLILVSILLFIFLDVTNLIYYIDFKDRYNVFLIVALTFLPTVVTNLANTYVTFKVGYKPAIIFSLVMRLYLYVIPIVPDPNEYLASIINFVVPIAYGLRVYSFFKKNNDKFVEHGYKTKVSKLLILPVLLIITMVYFTSGYFKYYAVAIASGSMEPKISKGDIVIIKKVENDKKLKVGDILAYEYHGNLIVHRIIKIVDEYGDFYIYTKGDANNIADNYPVQPKDVVGTVNFIIPFVGAPTVWLNEK